MDELTVGTPDDRQKPHPRDQPFTPEPAGRYEGEPGPVASSHPKPSPPEERPSDVELSPYEKALGDVPEAKVGTIVRWYADGHRPGPRDQSQAEPAIVVAQEPHHQLSLRVITLSHTLTQRFFTVRHVDDPDAVDEDRNQEGGWEHSEQTLQLHHLEVVVAEIWDLLHTQEITPRQAAAQAIHKAMRDTDGCGHHSLPSEGLLAAMQPAGDSPASIIPIEGDDIPGEPAE